MLNESDAIFDLRRLRGFVVGGRWSDALRYLARFLPPPDTRRPLSAEAMALRLFLGAHRSLANIVAGEDGSAAMYGQYLSHDRTLCHGAIRLRSIMLNVLCSRQQVRDSIDWECVRLKAALIVYTLVHRTPELKELVFRPDGPINKPHNVLPIGFGFHRRYPLKKQAHSILPSTILGKQARGARASALAKHYLGKRRSLLAISSPSQESCDELSMSKALNWVADIVDECLKAGKRVESHQVNPLQISVTEGKFTLYFFQSNKGT